MRRIIVGVGGVLGCLTVLWSCSEPLDGQKIYIDSGCARCHELDGSGGSQGPRLEGLAAKWTPQSLDVFLTDPPEYVKSDARLQAYEEDYMTPMPKLVIEPEKRKVLVEYLLKTHP